MPIRNVPVDKIDDNPFQPRSVYSRDAINDLAHSIKEVGLLHPPIVRQVDGRYQVCEGHLRTRAYRKLAADNPDAFETMPVDLRELTDDQMALFALEENLRRKDITPIDVARAVDKYLASFSDVSETALAGKMNMTQGNISNMRRVLTLPPKLLEKIDEGKISFTQGRELLVFKGLNAGTFSQWNSKESKNETLPKDEAWLMSEAVRQLDRSYGISNTVDGLKKAIYSVCESNLRRAYRRDVSWAASSDPLFDTAGCLKCEKMVRANETKAQVRQFCTDSECWDRHQEEHKKKSAEAARKKMTDDLAKRVAADAKAITQEIPEPAAEIEQEPAVVVDSTAARGSATGISAAEPERFESFEDVCKGCLNTSRCGGSVNVHVADKNESEDRRMFVCAFRMTKAEQNELAERALATMPDSFKAMVADKAGTRAEVLDIRELRMGRFSEEMKTGWAILGTETMKYMASSGECTDKCIKGFHYAFDSSETSGRVYYVCSDPKCIAQKKAAWTRAKNAQGMAKKKAEQKAIKEAAEKTETIDLPRLQLVLYSQLCGRHVSGQGYQWSTPGHVEWLGKRLGLEPSNGGAKRDVIWSKIQKCDAPELSRLLVEFCLTVCAYEGEVKDYRIQTTELLNLMDVGIHIEKAAKVKSPQQEPAGVEE